MSGYDYVRSMRSYYRPRTPRAALIAAEAELLPVEAIVYKGSSVKPLFEEPYDLDELERVLAQPDLSFGDAMMLQEIFQAITRGGDKEKALFAAESLGMLESRYAARVEVLRARMAERNEAYGAEDDAFALSRALYEEALVVGRSLPIRNHYLREAHAALADRKWERRRREAFNLRIRCLLGLGLVDQAGFELGMAGAPEASDPERVALAAEIAYHARDTRRLRALVSGLDLASKELSPELADALGAWRGD